MSGPSTTPLNPSLEAAVNLANKEFMKGFISGQVILCLLLFFFFRVFLLRNGEETRIEISKRKLILWKPPKQTRPPPRQYAFESHVLTKTNYEVHTHASETCDWINVLMGQVIAKYRSDPSVTANIIGLLANALNGNTRPGFMGPISITDFSLGEEYPLLKFARMRYAEQSSNLRAEIGFEFNDQITLGIDTQVLINWPKPCIASLPVSLTVSVIKFSGTVSIEFVAPPDSTETYWAVSILEDFMLEFEVRSLLGHRTKVKDLPKITSLITAKLRSVFVDEIVWPSFKRIHIPELFKTHMEKTAEMEAELANLVAELKATN
ncbi:ERMES complex subunit mmm1 [Chytridiales sp. JEL 0842]|nr:ERMES complex subunit mmm1 [Chytridiales sp. JEL 0842]